MAIKDLNAFLPLEYRRVKIGISLRGGSRNSWKRDSSPKTDKQTKTGGWGSGSPKSQVRCTFRTDQLKQIRGG